MASACHCGVLLGHPTSIILGDMYRVASRKMLPDGALHVLRTNDSNGMSEPSSQETDGKISPPRNKWSSRLKGGTHEDTHQVDAVIRGHDVGVGPRGTGRRAQSRVQRLHTPRLVRIQRFRIQHRGRRCATESHCGAYSLQWRWHAYDSGGYA